MPRSLFERTMEGLDLEKQYVQPLSSLSAKDALSQMGISLNTFEENINLLLSDSA